MTNINEVTTDNLNAGDRARPAGSGIDFTRISRVRMITNSKRRVDSDAGVRVCDSHDYWEVVDACKCGHDWSDHDGLGCCECDCLA